MHGTLGFVTNAYELKNEHCDIDGAILHPRVATPEHVEYLLCRQCGCIVFAELRYDPAVIDNEGNYVDDEEWVDSRAWIAARPTGEIREPEVLYGDFEWDREWTGQTSCGCRCCPYELRDERLEYQPREMWGQYAIADWRRQTRQTAAIAPVWLMAGILDWSATLAAVVVAAWSLLVIGIAAAAWRRERRLRGIAAGSTRGNIRRRSGATTQTNARAWGPDDAGWTDAAHSDVACVAAHSDVACAGQTECGDGSPARELPQGTSCDAIPQAESVDPPGHHRLQYINSYSEWCRSPHRRQNPDSYSAWCRASARRQSLPDRRY